VTDDVTWLRNVKIMTSRYIWGPLSQKRLEIRTRCQWTTYRKWLPGNHMVTWPTTSSDPKRSRSWPKYAYGSVSRKRVEIYRLSSNGPPIGNVPLRFEWRPVTQRGQGHDSNIFGAIISITAGDMDLVPIEHL